MLAALVLLGLASPGTDLAPARALLGEAGFSPDGAGALAYLRTWVPDPGQQAGIRAAIARLGDEDYDRREEASRQLRQAGPAARADLRRALDSPDAEVRRRAGDLLDQLRQDPGEVVAAACAVLRSTRPEGADALLLRFAPFAPDERAEAALLDAVGEVGLTPAVRAALTDAEPLRRRAAVCALGAADAAREPLRKALADADLVVRCEAGRSLARLGDRAGLAALVEGLTDGTPAVAHRAEETLWRIARETAPPVLLKSADGPARCRAGWRAWLADHGATIDPARMRLDDAPRGWLVVADDEKVGESPGHVRFFDLKGDVVRALDKMESPADVELLPGDRLLVAEHWSGKVTERDANGRVLWEYATGGKPVVARRLADGGTLVATYSDVTELDRAGRVRFTFQPNRGMLYGVAKRGEGRLVVVNGSGQVIEMDAKGAVLGEFKPEKYADGASYWASVELLGPDRYLLALSGSDRVVEVDGRGKIHWEATVPKPSYAGRLADGTTLVSCVDDKKVVVLDAAGKVIQTIALPGRPFRARRY